MDDDDDEVEILGEGGGGALGRPDAMSSGDEDDVFEYPPSQ